MTQREHREMVIKYVLEKYPDVIKANPDDYHEQMRVHRIIENSGIYVGTVNYDVGRKVIYQIHGLPVPGHTPNKRHISARSDRMKF